MIEQIPDIDENSNLTVKSSFIQTLSKLLKCCIGSGLLAIPYGFRFSGIIGGPILLIVIGFLSYYCWGLMIMAIQTTDSEFTNQTKNSLPNIIKKIFGARSVQFIVTQIMTILLLTSSNISYIIFIHEIVIEVSNSYGHIYFEYLIMVILFIISFILSFKKSLDSFNIFTQTSMILIIIVVSMIAYCCIKQIGKNENFYSLTTFQWSQFPIAFGIFIYSYDINGILTEIRSEMENPFNYLQVLLISMVIEFSLFCSFGILGYSAFNSQVNQIIVINIKSILQTYYNQSGLIIYYVLMFTYGCTLFNTTFLNNLPSNLMIESFIEELTQISNNKIIAIMTRLIYISIYFFQSVALFYPNFSSIISLTGCLCSVTLGVIIPFLLHQKLCQSSKIKLILNFSIVFFAFIFGIIGLVVNIIYFQS